MRPWAIRTRWHRIKSSSIDLLRDLLLRGPFWFAYLFSVLNRGTFIKVTSESEKVSFNQINKNTGHRIKYSKVDAETGEEVESSDIMKGYKVDTDTYLRS